MDGFGELKRLLFLGWMLLTELESGWYEWLVVFEAGRAQERKNLRLVEEVLEPGLFVAGGGLAPYC